METFMKLVTHPDPILKQVARPVRDDEHGEILKMLDQMLDVMYTGDGVGLAAPQVGDLRRFMLVDHSNGDDVKALRFMVNPVIIWQHPNFEWNEEGCLSFPGRRVRVARSIGIIVEYIDPRLAQLVTSTVEGFEARIVQHELDHLDGITLVDK